MIQAAINWFRTPMGQIVGLWAILGVCTLVFKPKTPEEYAALAARRPAWLWSRVAAFLTFMGGLGLDPSKVAASLVKVITGKVEPVEALRGGLGPYRASPVPPAPKLPKLNTETEPPPDGRSGLLTVSFAILALTCMLSNLATACTPGQRQTARTVLDVAKIACIIANQSLPDRDVQKVCDVADDLIDPMKDVLASSRAASAQAVASARVGCGPADAGAR